MDILLQLVLLVLGFVMLVKGADWFVDGAAGIAEKFGIPQLVIGLTIVAMGTSAPEAAVSISAAFKGAGAADITVGNVVGSNILNVLIILGLTAVITAVPVQVSTVRYEIPFVIVVSAILLVFGLSGNTISRVEGGIFWALFILYIMYLLYMTKKHPDAAEEASEPKSIWQLLLFLVVGIVLVILGSDVAVDAATILAQVAGLSEKFIGLTVIALGTSLPELVTSVSAARKGKADIAIGNIVGSNIVNILFVAGTTAIITPVPFVDSFKIDTLVSIAGVVILLLGVARSKKLKRPTGIVMLLAYAAYFVYLCIGR